MAFGLFGKRVPEPVAPACALDTRDGNPIMLRGIRVRVRAAGRHQAAS